MHIHLRIEASLDILIGDYISENFIAFLHGKGIKDYEIPFRGFRWDLQNVLDELDFAKKVKIATKTKKIDQKTQGKLFKVNELRVIFSHPQAHQIEIQAYNDKNKYLEALITLVEGYTAINAVFKDRQEKLKK